MAQPKGNSTCLIILLYNPSCGTLSHLDIFIITASMKTELDNMPIENVALYNYNITGKIIDESPLVKGASHVTITSTIISGINDVMRGRPCRINEGKLRHVTINRQTLNDV